MTAIRAFLFAAGCAASAGALAQGTGWYLGGSLGRATFTEWCVDDPAVLTCDDETSAWKLLGGYRLTRNVAVEASYIDWGEVDGTVAGVGTVSADQTSMGLAAVLSFDLAPQLAIFGKVGLLMTEQETRGATTRTRDETEFHYGVGARFGFTPNWAARAEWEKTEKLKVDMLSIGAEYRF